MPKDDDPKPGNDEKKFSQSELESIIDTRLAREKKKQDELIADKVKADEAKDAAEKAKKEADEAKAKLADDNRTAIELAKQEAKTEALAEVDDRLKAKDLEILTKDLVAEEGSNLMKSLKGLVKGNNREEILASIKSLEAGQAADLEAMKVQNPRTFGNPGNPRPKEVELIKKSEITAANMKNPEMRAKIMAAQAQGRVVDG